ncbi:MAG: sulfatase-like hydrolase/transferase [Lentisphaerae bacterium]|nr:sulfatase-like hydrolase/transferase [Lentisphaerota bacterium]
MKPNIVFILVDDMGYGDFAAFNNGLSSTPALDALIKESVCLTQHYTGSPVCNPSRAALLTGRYPHRTGSIDTLEWRGLERLALRETTLADMLRADGYATGLIGKWHLGAFDPRYHPRRRGFDDTVCFRGGMHDYYDWRIEWGTDTVRRGDGRYLTDLWTQEAVQFIHRHRQEPFFLHVTYNAPHTPLQAPASLVREFDDRAGLTEGVKTLYAMIKAMDAGVARILDTLQRCGLHENTVVVFSSDNGPQFGGRGEGRMDRFNCHFNGCKGNPYEGGIRVPGIVRWPAGGVSGGRTVDAMVHFVDWLPTLLAMAGAAVPRDNLPLDGVGVLPVLRGEPGETCTERCWQWNRYAPVGSSNAAIRDGDWKLVRPAIPETMTVPDVRHLQTSMYDPEYFIQHGIFKGGPERDIPPPPPPELFNIAEDPLERRDVSGAHPDRVHALSAKLDAWFESVEADRRTIADPWRLNPESGW